MKLMTLNTHSLVEPGYENKLKLFAEVVLRERPDVIALQEVNQSLGEPAVERERLLALGFVECRDCARCVEKAAIEAGAEAGESGEDVEYGAGGRCAEVPVRADNHAYRLAGLLAEGGAPYFWTWVPAKVGYGRYDEGTALFSRLPIAEAEWMYLTGSREYKNWKTRKALGITVDFDGTRCRFFSLHMGWWKDEDEPFAGQWERLSGYLRSLPGDVCFLMGDFNSPAGLQGEGWQLVSGSGWLDTYGLAAAKDDGVTVGGVIDGWRDDTRNADGTAPDAEGAENEVGAEGAEVAENAEGAGNTEGAGVAEAAPENGMRIDYIWVNREIPVLRSQVICNGINGPVVSDHYGVMIECEPDKCPGRGGL